MTYDDCRQVLNLINTAWPRQPLERSTQGLYAKMMADFDLDETLDAVNGLVCKLRYPPTIADIRQAVVEARCQLPDPQQAWMLVCLRYGSRRNSGDRNITLAPVIVAALDAAGINPHRFHTCENRRWLKEDFLDVYTVMRNDALRWEDRKSRHLDRRETANGNGYARVGAHLGVDEAVPQRLPPPPNAAIGGGDGLQ